jgi:hypothetical protein
MPRPPSIRQKLEQDLWRRHPRFAQHHSDRRRPGPDQPLSWPDRALLLLAALLVLLLIVRVESTSRLSGVSKAMSRAAAVPWP